MKGRKATKTTKSSALFTTEMKKQGLKMIQEEIDPTLGLGPMFTISALKEGTSNSDVAYRLYYAGEVCKASAKHRNAVAKAVKKRKQSDNSTLDIGLIAAGGVNKAPKLELAEAENKDRSTGSEVESESSSEISGSSSVSGVDD